MVKGDQGLDLSTKMSAGSAAAWDTGPTSAVADFMTEETTAETTEEGTATDGETTPEIGTDADRPPDVAAAEVTPERTNAAKVAASSARREAI
jgi:hypothetical protein